MSGVLAKDAGRKLEITVKHRCLSEKFPNYIKII